jgi:hypothetical protein
MARSDQSKSSLQKYVQPCSDWDNLCNGHRALGIGASFAGGGLDLADCLQRLQTSTPEPQEYATPLPAPSRSLLYHHSADQSWRIGIPASVDAEEGTLPRPILAQVTPRYRRAAKEDATSW